MIIYISMLICPAIVYLLYTVAKSGTDEDLSYESFIYQSNTKIISKEKNNQEISLFFCLLIFGYFIFWIGMRTDIADTSTYIGLFKAIPADIGRALEKIDWQEKGPLFWTFSAFFKNFISADPQWWLMTIAVICGLAVMKVLREYSVNFFYSSFLFIAMLTFSWMMNGMRQFICVAILFLCCNYIRDGKFLNFFAVILVLSAIHTTALLMIPIYFFVKCKPWSSRIFIFLLIIVFICIFAEPFFSGMDEFLGDTNYSGFSQQMQEDDGVNPFRVAFFAIPPILAYWKKDVLEKYSDEYKLLPICVNMSLIAGALYLVGMFSSGILIGRLPIYCEIYNLILIPFILKYGFDQEERNIVTFGYTLILVVYFLLTFDWYYCSNITGYVI